uniref:Uncharacterized protein n=1 Tax=Arundo donax TaxID=35708 RepID=A0A0A8YZK5_ARUDO
MKTVQNLLFHSVNKSRFQQRSLSSK